MAEIACAYNGTASETLTEPTSTKTADAGTGATLSLFSCRAFLIFARIAAERSETEAGADLTARAFSSVCSGIATYENSLKQSFIGKREGKALLKLL